MGAMFHILYPFISNARKINIYFIFTQENDKILVVNKIFCAFFIINVLFTPLFADSFLTAQQFPETFEDLPFAARIEVLRDGYMPYEVQYDDNGVCISGCAYHGITIKEDMDAVDEATEEMANLIEIEEEKAEASLPAQPDTPVPTTTDWCRNGKSTRLPLRYPVNMTNLAYMVTSDFGFRTSSPNGARFHPALDIGCPVGTPVYATADGVVETVSRQDANGGAGLFITIKHDNDLMTQYLHLNKALVSQGDRVVACQQIALSGNSGKNVSGGSYGAHLDYRIRFNSDKNKYVDILCPNKVSNRNSQQSYDVNIVNYNEKHSLFYNTYKFQNASAKHSKWRVEHGHCMRNIDDLLPDEVR